MKKIGILLLALFIYPLHLSFAESRLIWSFPSGTVESSPAMDQNGNIYFSNDDDRNLYALNPDGSLKWNIGVFGGGIFRDTPVIGADGSIYIKNGDAGSSGMLTAIDQNGQIKWQFHAPNSLGLAIGNDGTIYNSQYSQLSAINPDGSLKWELFEEHALWWQPVVNSTGKIITGYYDHDENSELMVSLDPDTGKVIWKKSVSIVANAIAIGNLNQIYVVSTDGGLYAFDENGSDLWVNTDVSFSTKGLAIADDGTIYADGRALTSSGTVKWTGDWWGIPAIGKDGVVYVSGRDGLNALNPDGSLAWKYTGIGNSNPIIGNNGILYAGSSSGGIIAIRTDSGGYCESSWPMQSGGYAHSARSYDYNKIHAGFLTSRSMGISPLPVQFTNYASGNPTTYLWDFGDGTSSDQLNPEHIYMNPGLYSVSLTVSGSDHQDTHTKQHCIWVHQENEFTYPSNPHISVSNTSGNDLSVARKSDGTVWRWSSGFAPAIIEGISDVAGLSAGHDQIFLIKQDKSVWGLGQNHCDLFGGVNVTTPVLLPGSSPVLDATAEGGAGEYPHNLNGTLLKDDNTAWQWDCINKEWYQWPEFTDILAVHTRYMFSDDFYEKFYQKKDGSFWKLDTNPNMVGRFATVIEPIKRFSAGPFHCLALNADGTIWAWGQNAYGQLGDGAQNDASDGNPTKVNGLTNVIAISAGGHHSLALKSDGTVWAWGSNGGGQIGDGTNQDRFEPVRVIDLPKAIAIAAGMDFSAAVTEDGNVWTWGYVSSVSPFFRYQPEKIGLNLISDNKPRLEVSPDHNWINGNDFPYDTPLVLTIDPVNSGNNLTANLTSDSSGNFNKNVYDFTDPSDPSISYKLQPGDVVTAVCGTHTVTVTVPDVTHAVDLETGAISGTASGFQTVLIVVYQLDGMVLCDTQVTIDPDGSFSTQCNGLEPGMGIDLILTDVDGNTLVYHGYNPIPTLQAMITHNWISGEGFPKDTSGAITINPGT
ncbi:MAG: PQQ-binding-like beta-propeller repeat protein, partial [Desulfatirhabdiaceae bacterium]